MSPPLVPGLPIVGNLLEFGHDPVGLFRRGHERFGRVFGVRLGRTRAAVLLGPEAHRFFFAETDRILRRRRAYQWMIPMFGDRFTLVAEGEVHARYREVFALPYEPRRLAAMAAATLDETERWFANLGDQGAFEVVESFGRLFVVAIVRALLGAEARGRLDEELWGLFRDLALGLEFVVPGFVPLPRFRRRDRARERLRELMREELARCRARPTTGGLVSELATIRDAEGQLLDDDFIVDFVAGTLWVGHETTMGQSSWTLLHLLQHPEFLAEVEAEAEKVVGDAPPDLEAQRRLERLEWALKETERLEPSVQMIARHNAQGYELLGHHVPEGWLSMICPPLSHRLPDVFADPERYDPTRFSPARAEDRRTPHALIGFGGGSHRCTGMALAYVEMKVLLTRVLRRYHLELRDVPRARRGPTPSRPEACRVAYRRR